jgi:DNA-binding CsgD family transcriptional regulator
MRRDGSPLFVAQRPNSETCPETFPLMRSLSRRPEGGLPPTSAVGFLLLDSSLRPIAFNAEAVQVLSYPDKPADVRQANVFLIEKIRASLFRQPLSREAPLVTEFRSGRRRYLCRAFLVDSDARGLAQPRTAVLLERAPVGSIPLSPVSQQFNLTRRERDALECLLQGLSNKEIANRMNVSPNTVKAFLRLIMLKMEVSSRAAILVKIMMTKPKWLTPSDEPA